MNRRRVELNSSVFFVLFSVAVLLKLANVRIAVADSRALLLPCRMEMLKLL
jgi:hypothetical protein